MLKKFQKIALACVIGGSFLVNGCQKKEEESSPRCIYDQSVFAAASMSAAKDDEQFARFKKNPFFNLLWENLSKEEGDKWLSVIEIEHPHLREKFDKFRESDQVGSPRVFSFGEAGDFSPSTLRLVAISGEMQSKLGSFAGKSVIQIGAGYGGLCKILGDISGFESYTLVDLPEQLALAKKYLDSFGVENVTFLTPDQLPKRAVYDLVISDMSFSEFNRSYQELFFDRVLKCSHSGFLLGRIFPKHYGVVPLNFGELKKRFEKNGNLSLCEMQEPSIEDENYLICFKSLSLN